MQSTARGPSGRVQSPSSADVLHVQGVFGARLLPDGGLVFRLRSAWKSFAAYELFPFPAMMAFAGATGGSHDPVFTGWEILSPLFAFYLVLLATLLRRRAVVIYPGQAECRLRQGNIELVSSFTWAGFASQESARRPFLFIDEGRFRLRCAWSASRQARRDAVAALNRLIGANPPNEKDLTNGVPSLAPWSSRGPGRGAFVEAVDVTALSADTVVFRATGPRVTLIYMAGSALPIFVFQACVLLFPNGRAVVASVAALEAILAWIIVPVLAVVVRVGRLKVRVSTGREVEVTDLGKHVVRPSNEWEFQDNYAGSIDDPDRSRPTCPFLTLHLQEGQHWIVSRQWGYSEPEVGDLARAMNRFVRAGAECGPLLTNWEA